MCGEVRDRDIDRGVGLRARQQAQLPELLLGLEAIAALDLDRRGPELGGIADPPLEEREELIVTRLSGRAHGRVNASAGREDREVVGAASARRELLPALTRVAKMRVRIDEAGHDHTSFGIDVGRAVDALDGRMRAAVTRRDDRPFARASTSCQTFASEVTV